MGLLHALFINIQMTKILASFRKTFHILWKHSATLSWRGKDGTVPSRDAAGWGEATLGSEPHDLGFGTAFATLKLYGLGEDRFSGLHIHCLFILPGSVSPFWQWVTVACPPRFPGKAQGMHCLWQLLPTCRCSGWDGFVSVKQPQPKELNFGPVSQP